MAKNPVHVIRKDGQWVVEREGAARPTSRHATQKEAEQKGRAAAKRDKVEFLLHGRNGKIRLRDSYGNDPRSRKG